MEQVIDHVILFLAYTTIGGGCLWAAAVAFRFLWKLFGGDVD